MSQDERPLMVTIRCTTYNHEPYIRECLEGFVMQKTNFRFEAIVHDDASTDGTAAIILEYADKYPDIIKPIIETENQYSKGDGSIGRIIDAQTRGKYIAICEGDDYWIDPLKLQKQVDILEQNSECSLVVSSCYVYDMANALYYEANPIPINESRFLTMHEVLREEGGLIPTASMCLRKEIFDSRPKEFGTQYVGDRPLRIWCAINGKVYYDVNRMTIYRMGAAGSFGQRTRTNKELAKTNLTQMNHFYDYFDKYTNFKYHEDVEYLKNREEYLCLSNIRSVQQFKCAHFKGLSIKTKLIMIVKSLIKSLFPSAIGKLKHCSKHYMRNLPKN